MAETKASPGEAQVTHELGAYEISDDFKHSCLPGKEEARLFNEDINGETPTVDDEEIPMIPRGVQPESGTAAKTTMTQGTIVFESLEKSKRVTPPPRVKKKVAFEDDCNLVQIKEIPRVESPMLEELRPCDPGQLVKELARLEPDVFTAAFKLAAPAQRKVTLASHSMALPGQCAISRTINKNTITSLCIHGKRTVQSERKPLKPRPKTFDNGRSKQTICMNHPGQTATEAVSSAQRPCSSPRHRPGKPEIVENDDNTRTLNSKPDDSTNSQTMVARHSPGATVLSTKYNNLCGPDNVLRGGTYYRPLVHYQGISVGSHKNRCMSDPRVRSAGSMFPRIHPSPYRQFSAPALRQASTVGGDTTTARRNSSDNAQEISSQSGVRTDRYRILAFRHHDLLQKSKILL